MLSSSPPHVRTLALTGWSVLVLVVVVLTLSLIPSAARVANALWLLGLLVTFVMLVVAFVQFIAHKSRG